MNEYQYFLYLNRIPLISLEKRAKSKSRQENFEDSFKCEVFVKKNDRSEDRGIIK